MGMSASQARLLSITGRLTHNELQSQLITNSKLRLATESEVATKKYMDALDSKKLMLGSYNDNGEKTYTDLTAASLLSYSELKNQYSLINNKNQIMVLYKDAKNYLSSNSMADFMDKYGIDKTDNPEFINGLKEIFGDDYETFMSGYVRGGTARQYISDYISGLMTNANSWTGGLNLDSSSTGYTLNNSATYNAWKSSSGIAPGMFSAGNLGGVLNNYYNTLLNPPEWDFGDSPIMPTIPNFATLAGAYRSSRCYSDVNGTNSTGIWHMDHNLAALFWGESGIGVDDTNTATIPITNSSGTITVQKNTYNSNDVSLTNTSNVNSNATTVNLVKALKDFSSYNCVQTVIKNVTDLYCDVIKYMHTNAQNTMRPTTYTISGSASASTPTDLYTRWQQFYTDLDNLQNAIRTEIETAYNSDLAAWNARYNSFVNSINQWQSSVEQLKTNLLDKIENLADEEIPDENDSRYQWYKNLYYRMGAGERKDDGSISNRHIKILDNNLVNSPEWLEFALSHGVLTLEQAQFDVNGSVNFDGMGTYDWVPIPYTNASDLSYQDDENKIAVAEVEYKKTITNIQSQDKKFDQDLKKLDTEHNALQTEYDAVKDIITKNVDRSFKAFT